MLNRGRPARRGPGRGVPRRLLPLALAGAMLAAPARAEDRAQKACEAIEDRINALAPFTSTFCTPAGGKRPGSYSFILVSQATVLGDEDRRKLWLVLSVAAAGSVLNEDPGLAVEDLSLADSQTLARDRTTWTLPAALAKQLQQRMRRGEIDADGMHAAIEKGLRKNRAPARPGREPEPRPAPAPR